MALRATSVFSFITVLVAAVWLFVGLPALSAFNARCAVPRSLWQGDGGLCLSYAEIAGKTLRGAALVFLARYAFAVLLLPWTRSIRAKGTDSKKLSLSAALTHPLPHHVFRLAYFTATTCWAWSFLRHPQQPIGGGGRDALAVSVLKSHALSLPALHKAADYLTLSAGFHLACLAFIAFEGYGAAGGPETSVQVSLAVGLLMAGVLGQHFALGATLQVAHDVCDILTSLCKLFVQVGANGAAISCGVLLAAAWVLVRLLGFGNRCLLPLIETLERRHSFPADAEPIIFASMLLCLLFLNIYWFSLLVKSFAILLRSGAVTDAHVESGKEDFAGAAGSRARSPAA